MPESKLKTTPEGMVAVPDIVPPPVSDNVPVWTCKPFSDVVSGSAIVVVPSPDERFTRPAFVIDPPAAVHTKVANACRALMSKGGYDPEYGPRLPRALAGTGLVDVGTSASSMLVHADATRGVPQWELLVAQLGPALLAHGLVTDDDLAAFSALCHDGDTVFFAPLMVSSWGRRPA